jgi:hypothetical protein
MRLLPLTRTIEPQSGKGRPTCLPLERQTSVSARSQGLAGARFSFLETADHEIPEKTF